MPVVGLNHINVRTPDYKQTVDFLQSALGMRATSIPGHDQIEHAAWLFDDTGAPVLHLASADLRYSAGEVLPSEPPRGSGAVHHIALSCTDYDAMRDRLAQERVAYRENVPEPGVRQMFVEDPTGITFELNFQEGERKS
jgi:catechol 2,3-dioxygenase-like lactoylglutathione lyase family enzyme